MAKNYKNTEFQLYGYLVQLRGLFRSNGIGGSEVEKIGENIELIQSRKFNVAVMGEFKRGKSSLINALLGLKILPADVTPATATINRITYGISPSMTIFYHDGTTEAADMKNLADYVTMLTEEGVKRAAQIREAVISYPTVICQNHVDIIDTPGLNDNIEMTKVTMRLLPDIDAVIVVVSALSPFSEKETEFVCQLIESDNVENVLFVVTYIDQIDEEEQDKFIQYIHGRIRSSVMERITGKSNSEEVMQKAKRILDNSKVYGVSSMQALKAFVTGDRSLLKESRFEVFKNDLYEFLTAQQGVNMIVKAGRAIKSAGEEFNRLCTAKIRDLQQEINDIEKYGAIIRSYLLENKMDMESTFEKVDIHLKNSLKGIQELKARFENNFFNSLTACQNQGQSGIINTLATEAAKCYETVNKEQAEKLKGQIFSIFSTAVNNFKEVRRKGLLEPIEELNKISSLDWKIFDCFSEDIPARLQSFGFPKFQWQASPIPSIQYLYNYDLMGNVKYAVNISVNTFYEHWNMYINAARNWWLQQALKEASANAGILSGALKELTEKKKNELLLLETSYHRQKAIVSDISANVDSIFSEIYGN